MKPVNTSHSSLSNQPLPTSDNPKGEPTSIIEQSSEHHIQAERKDLHRYKITDKNITSDMQAEISSSDSAAKTKSGKPKDIIKPPLPEQSAQHNKTFRQLASYSRRLHDNIHSRCVNGLIIFTEKENPQLLSPEKNHYIHP